MSKRPLCVAAVCSVLGILFSFWKISILLLVGACVIGYVVPVTALCIRGKPSKCVVQGLLVIVLLCVAYMRAEDCRIQPVPIEKGELVTIYGRVYDRQRKEDKTVLYLKQVQIVSQEEQVSKSKDFSKISNQSYSNMEDSNVKCIVYYGGQRNCSIGNVICVSGKFLPFEKATNPGQFDAQAYYQGQGLSFSVYQTDILENDNRQDKLREQLYQLRQFFHKKLDMLAGDKASILQAMLLGEKSQMDSEIKTLYQKSGISHILVISGLHFSMLGMGLYQLLRRLGASFAGAGGVSMSVLFLYGVMSGFGVSAMRAFVMFAVLMGAEVLGKGYDLPSALGASVLYLLYRNPYVLFQSGFQLSVGAILGIIVVIPVLDTLYPPRSWELKDSQLKNDTNKPLEKLKGWFIKIKYNLIKTLSSGIRSGIAIQILTLPILLYTFFECSIYSIFLNCLVLPLLPVVIYSAVAAIITVSLFPWAAKIIILPSVFVLDFYEWLCGIFGRLPYANFVTGKPQWYQLVIYYLLIGMISGFVYYMRGKLRNETNSASVSGLKANHSISEGNEDDLKNAGIKRRTYRHVCVGVFLLFLVGLFFLKNTGGIEISMLDVGQGQSIYIRSGSKDILYDGGSTDVSDVGKYRIVPFLKAKGVKDLELVMISHLDADHYNGITQMLEENLIKINMIMLPEIEDPEERYVEFIEFAKTKGVIVQTVETDDTFQIGKSVFRILHPSQGYRAADRNDTSIVMQFDYNDFSMLFTGDVEEDGEETMLDLGVVRNVDVLQTAHHGSDSSSTQAFLQQVSPKIALISCGRQNKYGHPSKEVLSRLRQLNCETHITMEEGCISFHIR